MLITANRKSRRCLKIKKRRSDEKIIVDRVMKQYLALFQLNTLKNLKRNIIYSGYTNLKKFTAQVLLRFCMNY